MRKNKINRLSLWSFILTLILISSLRVSAHAASWQPLNNTSHYKVSFDEDSILLNSLGRIEIWLRFIPKGENDRKYAATGYAEKRYRSHLEYYEIDCSAQTATLGLIDILGTSETRVKRLNGEGVAVPLLPGSVIESAALKICPVSTEDDEILYETLETENGEVTFTPNLNLTNEQLQQIQLLQKQTILQDVTPEVWKKLGNIYYDTNQPDLAIKAYQHVLDLQPNDTDTLNDQGAMYRQNGDYLKAVANFEKAFSLDKNNLESLYNTAYVQAFDLKDIPKAITFWEMYLQADSKSETAKQVMTFIEKYKK